MAVVDVGHAQPIQADSTSKSVGLVGGRRPPGALTYMHQDEPGELSQWL